MYTLYSKIAGECGGETVELGRKGEGRWGVARGRVAGGVGGIGEGEGIVMVLIGELNID